MAGLRSTGLAIGTPRILLSYVYRVSINELARRILWAVDVEALTWRDAEKRLEAFDAGMAKQRTPRLGPAPPKAKATAQFSICMHQKSNHRYA
jgi:hypothetical protein